MLRWSTNDSPATPYTRIYTWVMWLARDKKAFEGAAHTRRVARRRQRDGSRPPNHWTRLTTRVWSSTVAGMTVWRVAPRRRRPLARVVYVHGGGYVHPLTGDYWRLL